MALYYSMIIYLLIGIFDFYLKLFKMCEGQIFEIFGIKII